MARLLRTERDERGVATVTLARPETRNAFSAELMDELHATLFELATDEGLRALVLTGEGRAFSAGADLDWMASLVDRGFEENVEDSRGFERLLSALDGFPAPTMARVNGHALGGAMGLIACADIAVAVRGARLGFTEVRLGLVPAMISHAVQQRIGLSAARRYLLTGEHLDADEARRIGLVHEACDPEELDAAVEGLLEALLAGGPVAQRETKALLARNARSGDPDATRTDRLETIARARVGPEGQAGMRAFFDRQPPPWAPARPER